jgi:hypothetical protein
LRVSSNIIEREREREERERRQREKRGREDRERVVVNIPGLFSSKSLAEALLLFVSGLGFVGGATSPIFVFLLYFCETVVRNRCC